MLAEFLIRYKFPRSRGLKYIHFWYLHLIFLAIWYKFPRFRGLKQKNSILINTCTYRVIRYKFPRSRGLKPLFRKDKIVFTSKLDTNFPDLGDWNMGCSFLLLQKNKNRLDTNFPDLGDWNFVIEASNTFPSILIWYKFPDLGYWNLATIFLTMSSVNIWYKFPRSRGLKRYTVYP